MKIAISVQYGKRRMSYRGLACGGDVLMEGHAMLLLASELAVELENREHLAIVLSYNTMKKRADYVNAHRFDLVVGLSMTKQTPAVLYARKFDSEGKTAQLIADILSEHTIFSRPDIEYKTFPLRDQSSKLALVSYYNPERVKYAFVLAPFSCETRDYFLRSEFKKVFVSSVVELFNHREESQE